MDATYTDKFDSVVVPGTATIEAAGTYNRQYGNYAEWRGIAAVGWSYDAFNGLLSARYIDGITLEDPDGAPGIQPSIDLDSVTYLDLAFGYKFNDSLRFQVSVDNLTEEEPPLLYQNNVLNSNTDVSTYDLIGTYYRGELELQVLRSAGFGPIRGRAAQAARPFPLCGSTAACDVARLTSAGSRRIVGRSGGHAADPSGSGRLQHPSQSGHHPAQVRCSNRRRCCDTRAEVSTCNRLAISNDLAVTADRRSRPATGLLAVACSALLLGGVPVAWATSASTIATLPVAVPEPLAADVIYARSTTLDEAGRVLAPVMVNGQGPFHFILDTGANRSVLSPRVAELLDLTPSHATSINVHGVTGSAVLPAVEIRELRAGPLTVVRDKRMPVLPESVLADADGILGIEGLAGMRIDVDFESGHGHDHPLAWRAGRGGHAGRARQAAARGTAGRQRALRSSAGQGDHRHGRRAHARQRGAAARRWSCGVAPARLRRHDGARRDADAGRGNLPARARRSTLARPSSTTSRSPSATCTCSSTGASRTRRPC